MRESKVTHLIIKFFFLQVFPPTFRELPAPALDLFDLDECFSSEKTRLAQITNKCECTNMQKYYWWLFERKPTPIFGGVARTARLCLSSQRVEKIF